MFSMEGYGTDALIYIKVTIRSITIDVFEYLVIAHEQGNFCTGGEGVIL